MGLLPSRPQSCGLRTTLTDQPHLRAVLRAVTVRAVPVVFDCLGLDEFMVVCRAGGAVLELSPRCCARTRRRWHGTDQAATSNRRDDARAHGCSAAVEGHLRSIAGLGAPTGSFIAVGVGAATRGRSAPSAPSSAPGSQSLACGRHGDEPEASLPGRAGTAASASAIASADVL